MKPELFQSDWAAAFCAALDADATYREAAAGWQGAVGLVLQADADLGPPEDRTVLLDLHRGRCRGASADPGPALEEAAFVLTGPATQWRRILAGDLDPIFALMSGKLKLTRGSLPKLLPWASAAKRMVSVARTVEATLPPGWTDGGETP